MIVNVRRLKIIEENNRYQTSLVMTSSEFSIDTKGQGKLPALCNALGSRKFAPQINWIAPLLT